MKLHTLFTAVLAASLLTACSWVDLTPQGEKVRVLTAAEVDKCQRLGQTSVSLLSKVAGIERHKDKVQSELNVLARNSAVELGGDTVVPASPVVDGKQVFTVYRCVPR